MKIAWFTPFSEKSAIGMVSKEICEKLIQYCEVDIWTSDKTDLIHTQMNIVNFNIKTKIDILDKYDYIFYNMGNFANYHRRIYEMSIKKSGYIILHDQTMSDFWIEYCFFSEFGSYAQQEGFILYKSLLEQYYGKDAADLCQEAYDTQLPIHSYKNVSEYTLLQPFLKNALGVFTHADFFATKIKEIFNGHVANSYLPCKMSNDAECQDVTIREIILSAKKKGKKVLVSNGMVNPVKQIDKVTDVLLKNKKLAQSICYLVIGSYGGEYGEKLANLAKYELKDTLYMLNYQPYDVMNFALKNADLCVNMRYPNSEVCSLSLLEQMSFGKPVLVLDAGIYAEIPDDCVERIEYRAIEKNVEKILMNLADKDLHYKKMGQNAKNFVEKYCTTEEYVRKLLDFIDYAPMEHEIAKIENRVLNMIVPEMNFLGISEANSPSTCDNIVHNLYNIFNERHNEKFYKNRTVGLWAGFQMEHPDLAKEGISKFMSYLADSLIRFNDVKIEVWCYSFNTEQIKTCFSSILDDENYKNAIVIINERNWKEIYLPSQHETNVIGEVNERIDNLSTVARYFSKADVFMPFILYLDNVIGTEKRILVPAHDIVVSEHFLEFLDEDKLYKFKQLDISFRANNLARYGAEFVSNCKTILEKQILKYIGCLSEKKAHYVYLPVNVPHNINKRLLDEDEVRKQFKIIGRYMFYPTQIRPYKNISTLLRAFNKIKYDYPDLKLVLTGKPKDMPEVDNLITEYELNKKIVILNNLSEEELYSVYKYASVIPVTSTFEGGFSWQACEALFMQVPLILSKIDVVEERIEQCGFSCYDCGIFLFEPFDWIELAKGIKNALDFRDALVKNQSAFAEKLLEYSWKDASLKYYDILFAEGKKNRAQPELLKEKDFESWK